MGGEGDGGGALRRSDPHIYAHSSLRGVRSTPRGQRTGHSGQRSAALVTACGLKRAALCRLPAPLARGACGPMRPHDGPISHSRLTPDPVRIHTSRPNPAAAAGTYLRTPAPAPADPTIARLAPPRCPRSTPTESSHFRPYLPSHISVQRPTGRCAPIEIHTRCTAHGIRPPTPGPRPPTAPSRYERVRSLRARARCGH